MSLINWPSWPNVTGLLPGDVEEALRCAAVLPTQKQRLTAIDKATAAARLKYPQLFKKEKTK